MHISLCYWVSLYLVCKFTKAKNICMFIKKMHDGKQREKRLSEWVM